MIVIVRLPPGRASRWLAIGCGRDCSCNLVRLAGLIAAILVACPANAPSDIQPAVVNNVRPRPLVVHADPRAGRLGAFFEAHHCPQPHYIENYLRAADAHGLDYRLLPAISVRETSCGWAEKWNNRWGYHPGRQGFPSIEAGIDFLARQLAENAPYAGKTLYQKLLIYNPRPAYAGEVARIMKQIE